MRLLITGAGGFVGRALIAALAGGHDIVAIDRDCSAIRAGTVRRIEGDFADSRLIAQAVEGGVDAVVHLATMPGGAAEQDPAEAFRVNVTGSAALLDAITAGGRTPRMIFASSIAVFGDPMPEKVDDETPLRPRMVYGAHKAMIEQWIATLGRRGAIRGLSLRLPGIVARPRGPSGMKSAFLSDVFHAARHGEPFVSPVSPQATMWLMSVPCLVRNLIHALEAPMPGEPFALTLPAVVTTMDALVREIAAQTGWNAALVRHAPDAALEAAFGRQPPLEARAAHVAGFASDGSLPDLVGSALNVIRQETA